MKPYVYKRADDLGIPVVEARNRLLVTVTDDDVVQAKKSDSKHCALSRASLRLPGVNAAYFFRSMAFLEYPDKMVKFLLPQSVQREIVTFDRAHIMASGVYQLSKIPPTLKKNKRDKYEKKRSKAKTAERRKISTEVLDRIAAMDPVNDTPEQRTFNNRVATVLNRNAGSRTVSGAKSTKAPEPLSMGSPAKRYNPRTQYVRDLREPK